MTHPLLARAHLEALLLARVVLDPTFGEMVDPARLSPAAQLLLDAAMALPATAGAAGLLAAAEPTDCAESNRFVVRLVQRVERLALLEITYFPAHVLAGLVNALPVLGVVTPAPWDAFARGRRFGLDILARRGVA